MNHIHHIPAVLWLGSVSRLLILHWAVSQLGLMWLWFCCGCSLSEEVWPQDCAGCHCLDTFISDGGVRVGGQHQLNSMQGHSSGASRVRPLSVGCETQEGWVKGPPPSPPRRPWLYETQACAGTITSSCIIDTTGNSDHSVQRGSIHHWNIQQETGSKPYVPSHSAENRVTAVEKSADKGCGADWNA